MSSSMILWLPLIVLRSLLVGRRGPWIDALLLLAGAICIMAQEAAFEIEASWRNLPAYAVFGMLVFVLSVSVTASYPMQYLRLALQAFLGRKRRVHSRVAWRAAVTALSEEIVWRVVFQTILGMAVGIYAAVAVVAASFAFLHRHGTAGLTIQFVELLAFSLVLGTLFAMTRDVALVVVIHAIRNYLIGIQGADSEAQ